MTETKSYHDPLSEPYTSVERFERGTNWLSWLSIGSFAVYVICHFLDGEVSNFTEMNRAADAAKLIFIFITILTVLGSYLLRYVLQPQADRGRRRLLIGDGTGYWFSTERQTGYWNNEEPASVRRLLFNLAENTFFYPRLLRHELWTLMSMVVAFSVLLLPSIRFATPSVVELLAVLIVFSDLMMGRLVRILWTIHRMDLLYLEVNASVRARDSDEQSVYAACMEMLSEYEYIKGRSGCRASNRTFRRMNPGLSAEWLTVRELLESIH